MALQAKEKQIEQHFDPINKYRKQHPHIDDLRQDYQEDLENYGFTKQTFKPKKEQELEILEESIPTQKTRPTTAITPITTSSKLPRQRPITAPGLNVQVKHMMKIDENEEVIPSQYQITSDSKYWRNTKKYDKANPNVVRNHSALKRINLGTDFEEYNIQEQADRNYQFIEKKISTNKLLSPTSSNFFSKTAYQSDKDLKQLTEGFYEHFQLIKGKRPNQTQYALSNMEVDGKLAEIIKLIGADYAKSPVVIQTKSQGLRPQTAVQRLNLGKGQQNVRPMSGMPKQIFVRGHQF